jgi:hypothetical protein
MFNEIFKGGTPLKTHEKILFYGLDEVSIAIGLMGLLTLIIFLTKFKNTFKTFIKNKINFLRKNKLKASATLSILYLCLMLWLNWLGHQDPFFIYEMTYTWFLGWGVVPVLVLWSLYFIWRKK